MSPKLHWISASARRWLVFAQRPRQRPSVRHSWLPATRSTRLPASRELEPLWTSTAQPSSTARRPRRSQTATRRSSVVFEFQRSKLWLGAPPSSVEPHVCRRVLSSMRRRRLQTTWLLPDARSGSEHIFGRSKLRLAVRAEAVVGIKVRDDDPFSHFG